MNLGVKRLAIIASAIWTSVIAVPAHAEGKSVVGPNVSCGDWTKYDGSRKRWLLWVDGVLTGWNIGDDGSPDFITKNTPPSGWEAWLTNYCVQNPLDPLMRAVWALHGELVKRR
jgi:hypothetical protein